MLTAVALACAVACVLLAVPAPAGRGLDARLSGASASVLHPRRTRVLLGVLVSFLGLGVVVAAGALAGPRAAVLTVAGLIVTSTVVRLARQDRRLRAAQRTQADVARACGVLASHVRVGLVATEALAVSARDCPVLADGSRVLQIGGDVAATWRTQSTHPGHRGLLELARAWEVSTETGSPLAASLEQTAASLDEDQTLRAVVAGELSAPRATGKVMAVLPLMGIGLGYALGGDPLTWLLAGPLGWGCLLLGLGLAAAGVSWIEQLARSAGAQT